MKKTAILAAVLFLAAVTAGAAEYTVDTSHSSVGFKVRHIVTKVPGMFKDYEAAFSFDPAKPEASKGKFTIKAASIDTGNAKRDEHLRSADFFDVQKFPTITYEGTAFKPAGKDRYKLEGNFTMRGVTKPVAFDVEFTGLGKDPSGNNRAGFSAATKINRKDFGINWNKALDTGGVILGDDVDIQLEIEAVEKK
jgi:polyisoprenoid-binding protein YceI